MLSTFGRQTRRPPGVKLAVMLVVWLWLTCPHALAGQASGCSESGEVYAERGYRVRRIIIETPLSGHLPLGFVFGLESRLEGYFDSIKPELSLKEGEPFTKSAYNETAFKLAQLFGRLKLGERFRAAYTTTELRGCDDQAGTLDVVYRVYSSDYVSFLSRVFESQPDKITRSLLPEALASTGKILPAPFAGYNRSRGIFGGARFSIKTPLGLIKRTDIDVSGSNSSAVARLGMIGNHEFKSGWLNHAEWRMGYQYFNLPSDTIRHKGGALLAQTFVSTKPLGHQNLALRFGGSLEGGHLQTESPETSAVAADLLRTRYGSLKMYMGATMKAGRQSWKASYGLQLGQAGKEFRIDYVKQVFDSAHSVRFLLRDHLPLRVDTQFSAGLISSSSGRIPVAERFYGGNVQRNFIRGDDWQINSGVFIRSFPQNRLNRIGAQSPVGGKNFFSLNLTAAQTVWKRSLVPGELIHDPILSAELKTELRGVIEIQRYQLELSYLSETEEYRKLPPHLDRIAEALTRLKAIISGPELAALPEPASNLRRRADQRTASALAVISNFKESPDIAKIKQIVNGFPGVPSEVEKVGKAIDDLAAAIADPALAGQKERLKEDARELEDLRVKADADFNVAWNLLIIKPGDLKPAQDKLSRATEILDRIEQELRAIPAGRSEDVSVRRRVARNFVERAKLDAGEAGGQQNARQGLNNLVEGFEVAVSRLNGVIESLANLEKPLVDAKLIENWKKLEPEIDKLAALRKEMRQSLRKIPYTRPQLQAAEAVNYTGHMFDTIFRELNLVAVSPVVMFDVARIGPHTDPTYRGLRYGLGAGAKFSLVTLDVTAGYSWNLNRRPGEGGGALVFSMDISDLFR